MGAKIPIKMSDGTPVSSIAELRGHFDLKAILGHYESGRLIRWLEDHRFGEAKLVKELDPSSPDLNSRLCEIFGVEYSENEMNAVSITDASERNRRIAELKKHTSDDDILQNVDSVAFTQEELDSLTKKGVKKIYLCGEHFDIPNTFSMTYIGVNNPKVDVPEYFSDLNVKLVNVSLDREDTFKAAMSTDDPVKKAALLRDAAELGNVEAMVELADCYDEGNGVKEDKNEAFKWYLKAAEQGNANV